MLVAALEPILQSLVAAGVTIFAAAGDDGAYDCGTTRSTAVDYPASSPSVVAVGGSNLSAASSAPNTGANWTETAWSCTSATSCVSGGGTGGGTSSYFAMPSWQSTYLSAAPYAAATRRLLPDIAADGDPKTGFVVYTTDTATVADCGGTSCQFGGTSLAAPLSAAQLVDLLGDNGRTTGVGDIHADLYQASVATSCLAATDPARAFRDVTVGSNGGSTAAATGYDTVSGLGGVLWSALTPYLLDTAPAAPCQVSTGGNTAGTTGGTTTITPNGTISTPTPTTTGRIVATARLSARRVVRHHRPRRVLRARWHTTVTGSSIADARVTVRVGRRTVYTGTSSSGRAQVAARSGRTYVLTLTVTDDQGHASTSKRRVRVR